jgi:hypothetical protein
MPATRAVLLAAVIVALALLASVAMLPRQRYTLAQLSDGVALRLDTRSGETAVCVISREHDSGTLSTKYTATCDGRRRRTSGE